MATTNENAAAPSRGDIWVAVGVVACLGIGASMTFWLTSRPPEAPRAALPVKGEPINSAVRVQAPPGSTDGAAATGSSVPPAPGQVVKAPSATESEYTTVGFDTLGSFFYAIPDMEEPIAGATAETKRKDQIPAPIKALGGKKVAVKGFMMPLKSEKGAAKTFLLIKDQSICCFGRTPRMNEWISVKMTGDRTTRFIGDQAVTVFGKLDVGEEIEQGVVLSIYRMEADDVAGPLDL